MNSIFPTSYLHFYSEFYYIILTFKQLMWGRGSEDHSVATLVCGGATASSFTKKVLFYIILPVQCLLRNVLCSTVRPDGLADYRPHQQDSLYILQAKMGVCSFLIFKGVLIHLKICIFSVQGFS